MKDDDGKIDRLLRAAALSREEAPLEAPFGFDTRVVALWRAKEKAASLGLARLVRRPAYQQPTCTSAHARLWLVAPERAGRRHHRAGYPAGCTRRRQRDWTPTRILRQLHLPLFFGHRGLAL